MNKEEKIEAQRKQLLKENAILRTKNKQLQEENSLYRLQFESHTEHLNDLTEENKQLKSELRMAKGSEDAWEAIATKALEDKHFGEGNE